MEELANIYRELNKIRTEENISIEDDTLFSQAVDIYLFREGEKNKDKRTQDINNRQPQSDKAKEKQVNMLKKFGVKVDYATVTKKEASALIDKIFNKDKASEQEADAW